MVTLGSTCLPGLPLLVLAFAPYDFGPTGMVSMRTEHPEAQHNAETTVSRRGVLDLRSLVEPKLPVLEQSRVQVRPGPAALDVQILSSDKVWALGVRHYVASVGVTVLEPGFTAFMSWAGTEECRINGEPARPTNLYMPGAQNGFRVLGGCRETIGVAVRRNQLTDTVAALRGVDPDEVALDLRSLELTPRTAIRFRTRLVGLLRQGSRAISRDGARALSDEVFGLLVDAYFHAAPQHSRKSRAQPPERIVRKAEERYFAAEGSTISWADLCSAARVSQSALYRAFHGVCGEPPLAYFHRRRLMQTRRALLNSRPGIGAVKRVAISAGITDAWTFLGCVPEPFRRATFNDTDPVRSTLAARASREQNHGRDAQLARFAY